MIDGAIEGAGVDTIGGTPWVWALRLDGRDALPFDDGILLPFEAISGVPMGIIGIISVFAGAGVECAEVDILNKDFARDSPPFSFQRVMFLEVLSLTYCCTCRCTKAAVVT